MNQSEGWGSGDRNEMRSVKEEGKKSMTGISASLTQDFRDKKTTTSLQLLNPTLPPTGV